MAFSLKTWVDRISEFPNRRKLDTTGITDTYDVARSEGIVSIEGDKFNAANMNDLEDRTKTAIDAVETVASAASSNLSAHATDTTAHMTAAQKTALATAVQSATLGGVAVPKNGTTLQIPYTTAAQAGLGSVNNTADINKSVNYASSSNYANSAGSAPANGGTSAACSGNSATSNLSYNTTSVAGALTVSTAEPSAVLPAGTLWAVV